jgi:hypothetical protein
MTRAKASARFQEFLNSLKSKIDSKQSPLTKGGFFDRYILNREANTPTTPTPTPIDGGIRPVSRPIPGPQERVPDSDIKRQQLEDEYQLRFKKQQEEYGLRN